MSKHFIVLRVKHEPMYLEPPAFIPTGTLEVDKEGTYNVQNYEYVKVDIGAFRQFAFGNATLDTENAWIIKRDGSLWGWGGNGQREQGSGNNTTVWTSTKRLTGVSKVVHSGYVSWALKDDGTLWGCGYGRYGAQADGSYSNHYVTKFTQRLTNVKDVTLYSHTCVCALKNDGTVWVCGGVNESGCLTSFTQAPVNNVAKILWGRYVLKTDGSLHFLKVDKSNTSKPVDVVKEMDNVKDFMCVHSEDYQSKWILKNDNSLWGMGYNSEGQQGSGNTTNVKSYTRRLTNVKQFYCHKNVSWAVKNDGTLWGCGRNYAGNQGNGEAGTNKRVLTFTQRLTDVKKVNCSDVTTWALKNDGTLWGCGSSEYGQQGSGKTGSIKSFTRRLTNVKDVWCSEYGTFALKKDETLWFAGKNYLRNKGNVSDNALSFEQVNI